MFYDRCGIKWGLLRSIALSSLVMSMVHSFVVPTFTCNLNSLSTSTSLAVRRHCPGRRSRILQMVSTVAEDKASKQGKGGGEGTEEQRMAEIEELHSKALAFRREKKMSQAVAAYDELLPLLTSTNASQWKFRQDVSFERALCLSQMGYVNEAIDGFETIMRMKQPSSKMEDIADNNSPGREEIYLANILLEGRGDKLRALDIYQRCGPKSYLVMLAGVCLDSLGRHEEAKTCYQQALQLNGGDADHEAMVHLCINLQRCQKVSQKEIDLMEGLMSKVESSPSSHIATSWKYIYEKTNVWNERSVHYFTHDMIQLAMDNAQLKNGLILEFGVYFGKTIRMMASYFLDDTIHGFDTFEGLPGDWFNTKQGSYSTDGTIPKTPSNVKFYKGLFSDTLPGFLDDQLSPSDAPIRLMNVDCDMYASTKDIFDQVHDRVRPGTVIIFDEYVGNPNWKRDEFKAFQEAVEEFGWSYEYIGISMVSQQAIVRII